MELRSATAADVDAVARLHASSWRRTYAGTLSRAYLESRVDGDLYALWSARLTGGPENQHVIVLDDGSAPAGFACVFVDADSEWGCYLDNLHVSEHARGHGLGTALLSASARWSRARARVDRMYLSVNQDNRGARAFYRKMGARHVGSGTWDAPDGTSVPIHWLAWDSLEGLAEPRRDSRPPAGDSGGGGDSGDSSHGRP